MAIDLTLGCMLELSGKTFKKKCWSLGYPRFIRSKLLEVGPRHQHNAIGPEMMECLAKPGNLILKQGFSTLMCIPMT